MSEDHITREIRNDLEFFASRLLNKTEVPTEVPIEFADKLMNSNYRGEDIVSRCKDAARHLLMFATRAYSEHGIFPALATHSFLNNEDRLFYWRCIGVVAHAEEA